MSNKSINIKFPFQDSIKGFFLDTNLTTTDAIKSDILHVILTQKGQRMYNPKFGTNLYQYLFEPNDSITLQSIKDEANASLKYCMPNIEITKLTVENNEKTVTLSIYANNNEDIFSEEIFIQVEI
jgi:phage baseplate assembly protein W